MVTIRKARLTDLPAIGRMVAYYASQNILLPRSQADLRESVGDFFVAAERGQVLACGALKLYDNEMAEVRSLCVQPGLKSSGLGRALAERLLSEAEGRGLKTVFALTVAPDFFFKCGFREAPRENFPLKVWRDCVHCPKFFHCDEMTVAFDIIAKHESTSTQRPAAVEVPACWNSP
jgi:N-acetylglutamate synthase-like GNAT family acetyltransferase